MKMKNTINRESADRWSSPQEYQPGTTNTHEDDNDNIEPTDA